MEADIELKLRDADLAETSEARAKDGTVPKRCLDCGAVLQGHYCHVCGQPASVERLTMRHFVFHSIAEVYHANSKYLPTAWQLLTKPWVVIADYVNCRRSKLLDPISIFIFSILVKVVVRMLIGDHTHEAALAPVDIVTEAENPIIAIWYYLRDSILLVWLILGVPCAWLLPLFFRKNARTRYNFAEYTAAGMYMTGALYLFSIILLPFSGLLHNYVYVIMIAYGIVMASIGISKAYTFRSNWQRIWKTSVFMIAVPIIYITVLVAIVLLYYAIMEPESFMEVLLD